MRTIIITALLSGFSFSLLAQDVLIRNATVYTMLAEQPQQNTDLLLRNGQVQAIGSALEASADATIIDAAGRPVTPGLFAGISQLGIVEVSAEEATADAALSSNGMYPEFDITLAYNPLSAVIGVNRAEGLTWTLLGANSAGGEQPGFAAGMGGLIAGQGAVVSLDGKLKPVPATAPRALFVALGSNASMLTGNSRAAQYMMLQRAIGETQISARELANNQTLLTREGRAVLMRYIDGGLWVIQVDRAVDILQLLALAKKYDLDIIVHGGAEAWRVAKQLATANVPVILDSLENLPNSFDQLGARMDNAAILQQAGVRIAFSVAGMGTHNARKVRQLAGNAVAHGLSRQQALLALTRNPALMLGVANRHGAIAEQRPATLVLWSGDPLEVTSYAEQVWIDGQPVQQPSRQQLLLQRYLPQDPNRARQFID